MALGPSPPWLDQVLFDLQDPEVSAKFSSWENEFLPSISTQYANWKASTSRMAFGTARQREVLMNMHRRHLPERFKLINTFQPFED